MDELTPEQQEAANREVEQILSNPENESKFPEIFAEAKKIGYFDKKGASAQTDPVLDAIKANFGDYTSVDEFLGVAKKWKTDAEVNLSSFASLPEPLYKAMEAAIKGEDWVKVVTSNPLIDFSKSYNEEDLLKMYSPVKFTAEELADAENIAVKKAKQQAKQSFELDKQTHANNQLLAKQQGEAARKRAAESLDKAIDKFKKVNPKATEVQIQRLRNDLSNMRFQDKFFDGRGGFNEDAALNYFPIVFGEDYAKILTATVVDNSNKTAEELLRANQERHAREFSRKGSGADAGGKDAMLKNINSTFNRNSEPFKLKPAE